MRTAIAAVRSAICSRTRSHYADRRGAGEVSVGAPRNAWSRFQCSIAAPRPAARGARASVRSVRPRPR
jgi:hypothetical protein